MRAFVEEQAAKGGHGSADEYLRTLIREAQQREAKQRLEAMLLEGLEGGADRSRRRILGSVPGPPRRASRPCGRSIMRHIVIRDAALSDLHDLTDYLAGQSLNSRYASLGVDGTFRKLAAMPELGSPQDFGRPELVGLRRTRVPKFENYLIFYRPTEDGIEVLRVVHGARDLSGLFEDEDA